MTLELDWKRIVECDPRVWSATWARPLLLMIGLTGCLVIGLTGCGGKSVVSQMRDGTPPEAAAKVMELYDDNRDGKLIADELAASPGLAEGLSRIDANRDGVIDLAEMTARFAALDELSDVVAMQVLVTANGTSLDGATVTMTPDPCMGEGKQTYSGTSAAGAVGLQGSEVSMPGLPAGYYTVQVSQPAQSIDFKRGVEIGDDVPSPNRLSIDVSGKQPSGSSGR